MANIEELRAEFETAVRTISREGVEKVLTWLDKTDFYTAPASTQYHGSYEGGLLEHSLNVYKRAIELATKLKGSDLTEEERDSLTITSLFHDFCKINTYKVDYRNNKNEKGVWEKVPYYKYEPKPETDFPFTHGEKSMFIVSRLIRLSVEEMLALRWHMGAYDEAVQGHSKEMSKACEQYKLPLIIQMADQLATYWDESPEKKNDLF